MTIARDLANVASLLASSSSNVVFDDSIVVTGGTANGVPYLNGSKILTTGSALTFDGSNLAIGTSSTITARLNIQAGASATGTSAYFSNVDGTYNPYLLVQHSSAGVKLFNSSTWGGASNNLIFGNGSSPETMRIDAAGNLGLGAVPGGLSTGGCIQLQSGKFIHTNSFGRFWFNPGYQIGTVDYAGLYGPALTYLVKHNGTNWLSTGGGNAGALTIDEGRFSFSNSTTTILAPEEVVTWATRFSILQNGNAGLGVIPSSWSTNRRALQIGGATVAALGLTAQYSEVTYNTISTVAGPVYATSYPAAIVDFNNASAGGFAWRISTDPTPVAGNAVSLTQAMTLTSAGDLKLGATSPKARLVVAGVDTLYYNTATFANGTDPQYLDIICGRALTDGSVGGVASSLVMTLRSSGASSGILAFATGNAERVRILTNGDFCVGTANNSFSTGTGIFVRNAETAATYIGINHNTSSSSGNDYLAFGYNGGQIGGIAQVGSPGTGVAFNTTSDYRLKDAVGPIPDVIERFKKLIPRQYTWKESGTLDEGFFAHELAEVCANAVTGEKDAIDDEGKIKPQAIDYGRITPFLSAVIGNLLERIEQLEARLAQGDK